MDTLITPLRQSLYTQPYTCECALDLLTSVRTAPASRSCGLCYRTARSNYRTSSSLPAPFSRLPASSCSPGLPLPSPETEGGQ
eukprot:7850991-Pyramimonas_sp.AAC.2